MAAQQWSEVYDTGHTPPEATQGLPDFPYTSKTAQVQWDAHNASQPLTMAYIDEAPSRAPVSGESATIVLLHGEPSWSYLYRCVPLVLRRVADFDMRILFTGS